MERTRTQRHGRRRVDDASDVDVAVHAARVHVVDLVMAHRVDLVEVGRSRGLQVERLHVTGNDSRV